MTTPVHMVAWSYRPVKSFLFALASYVRQSECSIRKTLTCKSLQISANPVKYYRKRLGSPSICDFLRFLLGFTGFLQVRVFLVSYEHGCSQLDKRWAHYDIHAPLSDEIDGSSKRSTSNGNGARKRLELLESRARAVEAMENGSPTGRVRCRVC
jgi:hypothetical protein